MSLTATPSDSGAGIASVAFQYSADGTTGWTTIGTDNTGTAGVYSADWNTTAPPPLADGAYHLRARITDVATNVSTIDLHPGRRGRGRRRQHRAERLGRRADRGHPRQRHERDDLVGRRATRTRTPSPSSSTAP